MDARRPEAFQFGAFRLDRGRRTLIDGAGAAVPLTARAFDALVVFLEHAGETIERDALMDALWPGVVVEPNSLSQVVLALRRAIGEGSIVTIKGRGYQFVMPVTALAGPEAADAPPAARASATQEGVAHRSAGSSPRPGRFAPNSALAVIAFAMVAGAVLLALRTPGPFSAPGPTAAVQPSVAVLPFVNMSSDVEQEHFADGLSEELLNRLARIEGLRVIARTSSFAYKGRNPDVRDVGAELGVGHVLEGSVRRDGDQLRVAAQLIDTESGDHVWSETYDRNFGEVFAVQDEIAGAVARELSVMLGVSDSAELAGRTRDAEAYDLFLRALAVRNRNTPLDGLRAAELLRAAIDADPGFALAWAELAWALELAAIDSADYMALMSEAREAVGRAVALAPGMWEAHRERAFLHILDHQWAAATLAVADAREVAPSAALPCVDALLVPFLGGEIESAIACERGRREADPLSLDASVRLLIGLYESGREEEAYAEYERSRDLVGNRSFVEMFGLLLAWRNGDPALVDRHVRRVAGLVEPTPEPLATLVEVHADTARALEALRASMNAPGSQQPAVQFMHALWLAHYGDSASAALALHRAVIPQGGVLDTLWMRDFTEVRRQPQFRQTLRELGLADYWFASGDWPDNCQPVGTDDFECS